MQAVYEYACLAKIGHPGIVTQQDALLCSINDRLGLLCKRHGFDGEVPGEDIEPIGCSWVEDMMEAHGRIADRRDNGQSDSREPQVRVKKTEFF